MRKTLPIAGAEDKGTQVIILGPAADSVLTRITRGKNMIRFLFAIVYIEIVTDGRYSERWAPGQMTGFACFAPFRRGF
jgi:hypothetical protein